jgi:hypothetical protein
MRVARSGADDGNDRAVGSLARQLNACQKSRRQSGGDGGDRAMTEMLNLLAAGMFAFMLSACAFWPEKVFAPKRQKTRLDYLMERKDRLFESLRKLNLAYRAGRYKEEDFLALRALLEREAMQLMAEIVDLRLE